MKQFLLLLFLTLSAAYIFILSNSFGSVPPLGSLFDPSEGVYALARNAHHTGDDRIVLGGQTDSVTVVRDHRGVPHIFSENTFDAITALGYVVAQDRLFQLDFIPRVAAGRLSEILGSSMVETDRFLRETGMEWGAQKNYERIKEEKGIELDVVQAYVRGINAYISSMKKKELPLEFRLLNYEPEYYTELHVIRILQYMTFDLTYRTSDPVYAELNEKLGSESFKELYPVFADLFIPIIPEKGGLLPPQEKRPVYTSTEHSLAENTKGILRGLHEQHASLRGTLYEGYIEGKGSNNWAVGPPRSQNGSVVLAGDMHLSLWLPSIWYEAHISTPELNTYGVTIPGAPLPVEAFNNTLGWAFTNSGTDQIDYVALTLDETGNKYLYEGVYRELEVVSDTIKVKGADPVIENRYFSRWGPTIKDEKGAVSIQWVAHGTSRTLRAQWEMNHAKTMHEFQQALTYWDTPMQNIIYGDIEGNIAIRSTGVLPVRQDGFGVGVLNGSSAAAKWVDRVSFDEVPYSFNPPQGFLTSTNQQPADSTYLHYQGYDWGPGYRSLRIDALLRGKEKHTVEDIKRYQSDVYVVQRDLFVPLLEELEALSDKAEELRTILTNWEGISDVDRVEPLLFDHFLDNLNALTWDEAVFNEHRRPKEDRLYALLTGNVSPVWLDMQDTDAVDEAEDVLKRALEETVIQITDTYGWDKSNWLWGKHHKVVFKHYTRSEALRALWKGPFAFPGFTATLSPASNRETTHSASWRVVVDFSTSPPVGYGVYPGGQSGNPFSTNYDAHIQTYLDFDYFELLNPTSLDDLPEQEKSSSVVFAGNG
ncbi:MAG: penicillin acylase family protein [Rhodothermaceae bacterium]|nr:penicillin acylase family protein [Rhodothermaceae bacterium]